MSKRTNLMSVMLLAGASLLPLCAIAAATSTEQTASVAQQSGRVSGFVDDESGPIVGATVIVKGTKIGVATDIDGRFTLEGVKKGDVIQISYIGYKTHEITYNGQPRLDVTLIEDTQSLEEVVVVGYGTQKKATLTGSVSSVSGDEIRKMAAVNMTNTLAGKTAGVIANTRSGEPGEDSATITIRGKGTFGSSSPLIVVDGIADRDFSRLNPEDIESISVLKDASAAIYGARAANGVILVTTKRGREGKATVNYSGRYGISQPTRVPEMLNSYQYMTYINEYQLGHGALATFSDQQVAWAQNGQNPYQIYDTNWWDTVAKDWTQQTEHSISVTGGNEKMSYYVSGQYMWQDSNFKKSAQDYGQYQINSNLDIKVNDRIKVSLDILGRQENRERSIWSTEYLFDYLMKCKPIYGAYSPDGEYALIGMESASTNPALMGTTLPGQQKTSNNIINLKPSLHVDLDFITPGLYVEGYSALDFKFVNGKTLTHPYDVYEYISSGQEANGVWGYYENRRDQTGSINLTQWSSNSKNITLNARVGYSRTFNAVHKVDAFFAYEQNKYTYSYMSAGRNNYLSTAIPELDAGSDDPEDQSNSGYSTKTARQNWFGRVNYMYDGKYLAEVTMRYDGSMNFAPGHRWGLFPAFSLGWIMSEENFWESIKPAVSFFKLKGSWGKMGNDNITAFQYLSQYKYDSSSVMFGTVQKALYLSKTANPLVTWETACTTNLGFSAQFLGGKFGLDFDYFYSKRSDILMTRNASVPSYSGLSLPAENVGKMNNRGVEFVAYYNDSKGDFSWGVTGNFTFAKNKVVYQDEAEGLVDYKRITGHAYGGAQLYHAIGIYQTQEQIDNSAHLAGTQVGDLWYEDIDGDGQITEDKDMRYYENYSPIPRIIFGLTLNGGWKGFDLNVFFQGQAMCHQEVRPTMNMLTDFYENRWTVDNTDSKFPRACTNDSGYMDDVNGVSSTWWYRNAAFLRLKSLELGYTIPRSALAQLGVERLRVYLNANNLFTIDGIKVCDPEVASRIDSSGNTVASSGILSYPLQRTINFGVNLTF